MPVSTQSGKRMFSIAELDRRRNSLAYTNVAAALKPGNNFIHATLRGVPAFIDLTLMSPFYTPGQKKNTQLIVTARDPDHQVIIGSATYTSPITLVNSDKSGVVKLSRTTIQSPAEKVFVSYNGSGCPRDIISSLSTEQAAAFVPVIKPEAIYQLPQKHHAGLSAAASADGIWFTETHGIAQVTTAGQIHEYPTLAYSFDPAKLVIGPDGRPWYSTNQQSASPNAAAGVGRVNADGSITVYPLPVYPPASYGIDTFATGPLGKLWLSYEGTIYSLTTGGTYATEVTGLARLDSMAVGPDGNLWFTAVGQKYKYAPGGTPLLIADSKTTAFNGFFVSDGRSLYLAGSSGIALIDPSTGKITHHYPYTPYARPSTGSTSLWFGEDPDFMGYVGIARFRSNDGSFCRYDVDGPKLSEADFNGGVNPIVGTDGRLWFSWADRIGRSLIPPM